MTGLRQIICSRKVADLVADLHPHLRDGDSRAVLRGSVCTSYVAVLRDKLL